MTFLTAASCPKKDFYAPPPQKNVQQTFILHTQNSTSFVLRTQKSAKKQAQKSQQKRRQKGSKKAAKKTTKKASKKVAKRWQKRHQERQQKFLFLNMSCCCLETGLKPVFL